MFFQPRRRPTQRGSTMIEVMVATAFLSVAIACASTSVATQMRAHATQTMVATTLNASRTALRVIADQVAMAGFGVPSATTPSAAPKLIAATPSQFSFWSTTNAGHTYLAAAAAKNSATLVLSSPACLTPGVSFYITDAARWYFGSVQLVAGNTAFIVPALTYDFSAGSLVTPVEQVTFQLAGNQLQRNGHTIIGDVTALNFTYDAATLGAIRQIGITLSAQTLAVDRATRQRLVLTQVARVAPPNLGM